MPHPHGVAQNQSRPDIFERWWQTQGTWVEAPNQRRGGESGVQFLRNQAQQLLYLKRQSGHLHRSWRHPFGQPTVLRELQAMQAFTALGIRVPKLVYCDAQKSAGQWRALLVTEALEGFVSLDQWYASDAPQQWGDALKRQLLEQMGVILSRLHRGRWQHSCLYAKHIFVKHHSLANGDGVEIALLDLEKSRQRWSQGAAERHDLGQLYRHREGMPAADWQTFIEAYQGANSK
ncbi:MAG: lipopolysaccharide kinase InaA family protein [Pseudomonas sp.]